MDPQRVKVLAAVAVAGALAAGAWWARSTLGIEWTPAALRDLVQGAGLWGPVLFVVLISIRPVLFIPSQFFFVTAGLCFGTLAGALYAALGVTIGGVIVYGLTHWFGRDALLARMPIGVRGLVEGGGRMAALAVLFVGTAYPIGPILWLAVGATLTGLALPPYVAALFAGGFLRAATYAYFGNSLVEAQMHEMILGAAAIGAATLLPLLHPRVRAEIRRVLREE